MYRRTDSKQCYGWYSNVSPPPSEIVVIHIYKTVTACPSGRAVWGVGQRQLACWDCGFESLRGHGCLSVVSVVCCQVEVSATGWSLVQRSLTKRGLCNGVLSRILDNEEVLDHWGLLHHGTINKWCRKQITTHLLLNFSTISSYIPHLRSNLPQDTLNLFRNALVLIQK